MMLTAGGNCPLPTGELVIRVQTGIEADISAYCLNLNGKVANDADMIFYAQPCSQDGSVKLTNGGINTTFFVALTKLSAGIDKVAFACTSSTGQNIVSLTPISIQVEQNGKVLASANVDTAGRTEAALILGELYIRNSEWKFRFVSQGFNGGLKPLAEHFGVVVDDESSAPTPPPTKPVSLSKISLTKSNPTVNLAKRDDYGLVKINLNWHQGSNTRSKGGFFNKIFGGSSDAIDLDLGCFVRLKDGSLIVIQALGGNFGNLNDRPYVHLLGDDRTGSSSSGEWLHINGKHWKDIDEVLIYTFIYDGVADWSKTDAVVTLHVPNESPIETRLTEGSQASEMCAIARLVNKNGSFHIERINRYFSDQEALDKAFGWGFRWTPGRK